MRRSLLGSFHAATAAVAAACRARHAWSRDLNFRWPWIQTRRSATRPTSKGSCCFALPTREGECKSVANHLLIADDPFAACTRRPNLELKLGAEGDALEIQYEKRFRSGAQPPPPRQDRPATVHFHSPEDLIVHLERCLPSQRKSRQER